MSLPRSLLSITFIFALTAPAHAEVDVTQFAPVSSASADMHPELARQYLEAARWAAQNEDYDALLEHLGKAAEFGSGGAHYELARLRIEGSQVPRDLNKASIHLNAAAGLGYNEGMRVLGRMLIRGDLDVTDVDRGFSLMESAAQSSVRAKRELGMLYAGLLPSPRLNHAKGRDLLLSALYDGDQDAGYQLSRLDEYYEDIPQETPSNTSMAPQSEPVDPAPSSPPTQQHRPIYSAQTEQATQMSGRPISLAHLTGDDVYRMANEKLIEPGTRTLATEARAYAMFSIAHDMGNDEAGKELVYQDTINQRMRKQDRQWLDKMKQEVRAELAGH